MLFNTIIIISVLRIIDALRIRPNGYYYIILSSDDIGWKKNTLNIAATAVCKDTLLS